MKLFCRNSAVKQIIVPKRGIHFYRTIAMNDIDAVVMAFGNADFEFCRSAFNGNIGTVGKEHGA